MLMSCKVNDGLIWERLTRNDRLDGARVVRIKWDRKKQYVG
jgi:hypothetical protein